jgi:subtilase family serine protease
MQRRIAVIAIALATVFGGLALSTPAQASPTPSAQVTPAKFIHTRVCAKVTHKMHCDAILVTPTASSGIKPDASSPGGLNPPDLQSAYNLPSASAGSGQTVAIVDAYDDPNAESDVAAYRSEFGLAACTSGNGCFRKVDQDGSANYPQADASWSEEISLDLDMASAICPNCNILLVEADSPTDTNLGAAVDEAVALGATEVSNSYGGGDTPDSSDYNHPGVMITASSGDDAYGVEYPASSRYVTAVGGTNLQRDGSARGWSETAWGDAGSGCSSYNPALSGQAAFDTGCSNRAVADVSAVADPNTGVSVYDTYGGVGGWLVFGGTSVSSPIIASVYALAGNAAGIDNNYPYTHDSASTLNDVTSGSNGSCSPSQLCTARVGWDGPTGLGTPNGVGAF